jgi:hypothetical protein
MIDGLAGLAAVDPARVRRERFDAEQLRPLETASSRRGPKL